MSVVSKKDLHSRKSYYWRGCVIQPENSGIIVQIAQLKDQKELGFRSR